MYSHITDHDSKLQNISQLFFRNHIIIPLVIKYIFSQRFFMSHIIGTYLHSQVIVHLAIYICAYIILVATTTKGISYIATTIIWQLAS